MAFAEPHTAAPRAVSDADLSDAFDPYIETRDGRHTLRFLVDGIHCGQCVWKIEQALARGLGVTAARVNLSTRRLSLTWRGAASDAARFVDAVERLGYRLVAYDPAALDTGARQEERALLRAVAVAGFATANVMLLSIAVWAGAGSDALDFGAHRAAGSGLRRAALLPRGGERALPPAAHDGGPDLARGDRGSRHEPVRDRVGGGTHVYLDSACALLFFLLIGRYLDRRAIGRARSAAEQFLGLRAHAVTVIDADGRERRTAPEQVRPGMRVLVAAGEWIGVDGTVDGVAATVDTSFITGEAAPATLAHGDIAYAGMVNLAGPLRLSVTAVGNDTLLAEIVRLTEAAEAERTRYQALADRLASLYAPIVHGLSVASFLGWYLIGGADWQAALLIAIAVLIVTCPCAFGLAVPMVQAVTSGRLMRRGVIVKSGTALERLARIDQVVLDKTGTLTCGTPMPDLDDITPADLKIAASLAAMSPAIPWRRRWLVLTAPRARRRTRPRHRVSGSRARSPGSACASAAGPGAAWRRMTKLRSPSSGPRARAARRCVSPSPTPSGPIPRFGGRACADTGPVGHASGGGDARSRSLAGRVQARRQGGGARRALARGPSPPHGRRRAERCAGAGCGLRLDVAGERREREPGGGRSRVPGREARARGRDYRACPARGQGGVPELRARLLIQCHHHSAGDGGAGVAAGLGDRDVGLLTRGRAERLAPRTGGQRMSMLLYLIPAAVFLGLGAFLWSVRSGQYDDLDGAAHRILFDDETRDEREEDQP